jgi:fluoride exporter
MLKTILLLGCGGFIGTVARYGTYLLMSRWLGAAFPWGHICGQCPGESACWFGAWNIHKKHS